MKAHENTLLHQMFRVLPGFAERTNLLLYSIIIY